MKTTLIAFKDGSYKKVTHVKWKHSQWLHFTKPDGTTVSANYRNINYLEELPEEGGSVTHETKETERPEK